MLNELKKIEFLDCAMHVLTLAETVEIIQSKVSQGVFLQHVVVNVAKLVNMRKDDELKRSVSGCDIVNIDGMGIVFGANLLGYNVTERVSGIDLFYALLSMAERNEFPVYFLGATQEVLNKTVINLSRNYPRLIIAGAHNGYFDSDESSVVHDIVKSQAKLLFVAITSPKKENFINRWKESLGVNFVMGVGGTFDVVSGKVKRAPAWMQRCGLEWFYRVIQEPRRMFLRYLKTNLIFIFLVIKEYFLKLFKR